MSKDPAFPLYSGDFIVGTMFMTDKDVGIYIRLLCAQHQHGGMIEKDVFNNTVGNHKKVRDKFIETDDGFYNDRLMQEMIKRKKKSTSLSENALKRWTMQKQCKSNAKATDLHMPTEDEDRDEDKDVNRDRKEIPEELIQISKTYHNYQNKQHPTLLKKIDDKLIEDGAKELNKLICINKYTVDDIKRVLEFAKKDNFWSSQILSLRGIRNKGKNDNIKFVNAMISLDKNPSVSNRKTFTHKEIVEWTKAELIKWEDVLNNPDGKKGAPWEFKNQEAYEKMKGLGFRVRNFSH